MNPNDLQTSINMIKDNLQPLAEKIGQGVGWTYELFVRQVYVNAFTGLLWCIPGTILLILIKKFNSEKFQEWENENYLEGLHIWLAIVFGIVSLALVLLPLSDLIQALVNPNYQAIKLIIDMVKTQTIK